MVYQMFYRLSYLGHTFCFSPIFTPFLSHK